MKYNKEEIINKIAQEAFDLVMEYDVHSATINNVTKAVTYGYNNKENLRKLLSNSTLGTWIPEKDQLVLDFSYTREVDAATFGRQMEELYYVFYDWINSKECSIEDAHKAFREEYDFRVIMNGIRTNIVDEERIERLEQLLPELKVNYGMKTSRVVNKFYSKLYHCEKYQKTIIEHKRDEHGRLVYDKDGFPVYEEKVIHPYNREFAKLADSCNPINYKRKVIFSISYLDFLTMSFGNTWASCHTIDKENKRETKGEHYEGMYCGGTLSYANDATTIITYTVNENYNPENGKVVTWNGNDYRGYETQDKINRQLIHVKGNMLIQARLYPQSEDGAVDLYRVFREIEERVVADCKRKPNLWDPKGFTAIRDVVNTPYDAHHYRDYLSYNDCGLYLLKGDDGEYRVDEEKMTIGHYGIDLYTGEIIDASERFNGWLSMSDANVYKCTECGEIIDEDDVVWVNGDPYCQSCTFFCDYHNEWEVREDVEARYVRGYGDICEEGIEEEIGNGNILRCEACGDIYGAHSWSTPDGYSTEDGDWYCSQTCYRSDGYVESEQEGYLIPEDEAVRLGDDWVREGSEVECEECGQIILAEDAECVNGRIICRECIERKLEEKLQANQ